MIFRQLTHDDLGCASYLIGDERAGVDPKLDIDEYLRLARYLGVRIEPFDDGFELELGSLTIRALHGPRRLALRRPGTGPPDLLAAGEHRQVVRHRVIGVAVEPNARNDLLISHVDSLHSHLSMGVCQKPPAN